VSDLMKPASKQDIVWLAYKSAVVLGCMLGADALARAGTLRLTFFDAGELLAAVVVIALLPSSYRVPVGGITFAVAAIAGVARTVNVVAHALLDSKAVPIRSDEYVVQAAVYGTYIVLFLRARQIAKRASKTA
jgi:hypothetical protein